MSSGVHVIRVKMIQYKDFICIGSMQDLTADAEHIKSMVSLG